MKPRIWFFAGWWFCATDPSVWSMGYTPKEAFDNMTRDDVEIVLVPIL